MYDLDRYDNLARAIPGDDAATMPLDLIIAAVFQRFHELCPYQAYRVAHTIWTSRPAGFGSR